MLLVVVIPIWLHRSPMVNVAVVSDPVLVETTFWPPTVFFFQQSSRLMKGLGFADILRRRIRSPRGAADRLRLRTNLLLRLIILLLLNIPDDHELTHVKNVNVEQARKSPEGRAAKIRTVTTFQMSKHFPQLIEDIRANQDYVAQYTSVRLRNFIIRWCAENQIVISHHQLETCEINLPQHVRHAISEAERLGLASHPPLASTPPVITLDGDCTTERDDDGQAAPGSPLSRDFEGFEAVLRCLQPEGAGGD